MVNTAGSTGVTLPRQRCSRWGRGNPTCTSIRVANAFDPYDPNWDIHWISIGYPMDIGYPRYSRCIITHLDTVRSVSNWQAVRWLLGPPRLFHPLFAGPGLPVLQRLWLSRGSFGCHLWAMVGLQMSKPCWHGATMFQLWVTVNRAFSVQKENKNLGSADFVDGVPIFGSLFVIHWYTTKRSQMGVEDPNNFNPSQQIPFWAVQCRTACGIQQMHHELYQEIRTEIRLDRNPPENGHIQLPHPVRIQDEAKEFIRGVLWVTFINTQDGIFPT